MNNIEINDINTTNENLDQVKGGGLLLPAVQKVRDAAAKSSFTGGVRVAAGDVNAD